MSINALRHNNKIRIVVKGSSIGIEQEKLKNIFSVKENKSIGAKGEKGTSLGLFFCKEFAIKNQGDIWVESKPNKESTFYFYRTYC